MGVQIKRDKPSYTCVMYTNMSDRNPAHVTATPIAEGLFERASECTIKVENGEERHYYCFSSGVALDVDKETTSNPCNMQ